MVLDSLLAGVMLFSSFAVRTPNVQPNPDDYEVSIGVTHKYFHFNRQWERELGTKYNDVLAWAKFDEGIERMRTLLINRFTDVRDTRVSRLINVPHGNG